MLLLFLLGKLLLFLLRTLLLLLYPLLLFLLLGIQLFFQQFFHGLLLLLDSLLLLLLCLLSVLFLESKFLLIDCDRCVDLGHGFLDLGELERVFESEIDLDEDENLLGSHLLD